MPPPPPRYFRVPSPVRSLTLCQGNTYHNYTSWYRPVHTVSMLRLALHLIGPQPTPVHIRHSWRVPSTCKRTPRCPRCRIAAVRPLQSVPLNPPPAARLPNEGALHAAVTEPRRTLCGGFVVSPATQRKAAPQPQTPCLVSLAHTPPACTALTRASAEPCAAICRPSSAVQSSEVEDVRSHPQAASSTRPPHLTSRGDSSATPSP